MQTSFVYRYPSTDSTCDKMGINHITSENAMRRRLENKILHCVKRTDCRKQLAVYGNGKRLIGFVNMYHDGKAFWHDITTNVKLGRTYKVGDDVWKLTNKLMREYAGEHDKSVNVYAVRF